MILDLICDFHWRIDSVVFILAVLDFSNHVKGTVSKSSIIFDRNHRLRQKLSILFENDYFIM